MSPSRARKFDQPMAADETGALAAYRISPVAAVVAATVIGAAVRFSTVGLQSYWDDEIFTVDLMHQSFVHMLQSVPRTERTPHFYYLVAWVWARVTGTGEWGLRSLSAVIGTATIPIVYLAARTLGSVRGAVVAAFLVATNPFLIWYSQEARAYALLAFFSALSLLALGHALRGDRLSLFLWAVSAILMLATHYFALFIVASEAAWLLFALGIRRATLAAVGAVGLFCCAYLPVAVRQSGRHQEVIGTSLQTRIVQVPVHLLVGYGITSVAVGKVALALTVVLLAFAAWLLLGSPREERHGAVLAAGVGLAAVALPFVGAYAGSDFVKTLYFVATIPLFAIAIGQGFGSTRTGVVAGLVVSAIGLSVAGYVAATPWLQRPDLRGVATALGTPQVSRAIVLAPTIRIDGYMRGLTSLPRHGRPVREVDFVAMPTKSAGGLPHVPRSLPHPFYAAGFRRWRQDFSQGFTILRFRASSPHRVTESELLNSSFREWPRSLSSVVGQQEGRR